MSTSTTSSPALLLAGLALLVSTGHLAYALTSPTPARTEVVTNTAPATAASPSGATPECACDDRALRGELAELRETLALVRAQANRPAPTVPSTPGVPTLPDRPEPNEKERAMALRGDGPLPKINIFLDIPHGVNLSQRPDGTLDITAVDPATSGQEYLVYVLTETGETKPILFTVP